jgi:succinate dehydrogenase (ubiquinone) membrane anchor subunit
MAAARSLVMFTASKGVNGRTILNGCLLSRYSAAIVPRKSIVLSAANRSRVYGPEELSERKDEVHHWTNERYVAGALVPIIPIALAFPNLVTDTILCGGMLLHTHWRLSGVVQDYIHGSAYYFFKYLVLVLSIVSFGSMCYFNYADVGFGKAVRMIYTQL